MFSLDNPRSVAEAQCTIAQSNVNKIRDACYKVNKSGLADNVFVSRTNSIEGALQEITRAYMPLLDKLHGQGPLTLKDGSTAEDACDKSLQLVVIMSKEIAAVKQRKRARDAEAKARKKEEAEESKVRKKARVGEASYKPGGSNA